MIVYKVVDPDFTSPCIKVKPWGVRYAIGKVARGHRRPGKHRTPLFACATLAEARTFAYIHSPGGVILRCYTPSVKKPHRVWNSRQHDTELACLTLEDFWRTPPNKRAVFSDGYNDVSNSTFVPNEGVLCPSLLPIEKVEEIW